MAREGGERYQPASCLKPSHLQICSDGQLCQLHAKGPLALQTLTQQFVTRAAASTCAVRTDAVAREMCALTF